MKKFLSGYLACSALHSLNQDFMGMEKYIEFVRIAWLSPSITIPFAIMLLILSGVLYAESEKETVIYIKESK